MTEMTDSGRAAELLAAYDDQVRGSSESDSVPTSVDGPVIRVEYPQRGLVARPRYDDLHHRSAAFEAQPRSTTQASHFGAGFEFQV